MTDPERNGKDAQIARDGWQTIDSAPKDGKVVLLFTKYRVMYCGSYRSGNMGEPQPDERAWRCNSAGRFATPTHWMPLPNPPTSP
jgi:hypothetical protein